MGFDAVRGHAAAKEQLRTAFARGRLAHAFLFAGPQGVGKRTFAAEFAKALLCENPPAGFDACDLCPACRQVAAGTHPQFYVAKTPEDKQELPVEVTRDFRSRLALRPARGGRSVGVVEDADDFNDSSANCLLKTLEEPPAGAVLVLLATDLARQLPTVRSRCQVVPFHPLGDIDVAGVLADHGVTDPAEIARLVRLAGGSPGLAVDLAGGALADFRGTLLAALGAARPDPVLLAHEWITVCEEAGKESAAQRARASNSLRIVLDVLRLALRVALDPASAAGDDAAAVRAIGGRGGPAGVAHWLEACTEADYLIGRKVQLALVLEKLAGQLATRPA